MYHLGDESVSRYAMGMNGTLTLLLPIFYCFFSLCDKFSLMDKYTVRCMYINCQLAPQEQPL